MLLRNDGVPAYNLAVVVDDAFSGIDQVVRGDDLLPAAATQAFLAELLGYPTPIYAHVPLAVNAKADGWPSETVPSPPGAGCAGLGAEHCFGLIAESLDLASPGERLARCTARTLRSCATATRAMGSGPFQGSKVGHVIIWADGTVTALRGQWKGAVELTVARRDADAASEVPALAYTDLMAAPSVGDRAVECRGPGSRPRDRRLRPGDRRPGR